ncbi:HD domain-containing phosphohydrolase [Thermosediminibacter litoriperuensis]|uniref:Diguanylate cyclase (GGDEF)-like protein n=1 Tax=Thermosediminibacter litoriperuensis TaxID=291989 RepID=A0A5S5ASJ9_9FIRM|nr:HD domain-containing phosphohydrolase [Thermosediminibacter litoriperuensis]TYP53795.1 diguanylate cyclase (GGDEF)-like protein [Thermosediminibacter litoriperuensis]
MGKSNGITDDFLKLLLNSIEVNLCVIDESGKILLVNRKWEEFARKNGIADVRMVGPGVNYLKVLENAVRDEYMDLGLARVALEGIREILAGKREEFYLEYPCHADSEDRWYLMVVSRIDSNPVTAAICHINITETKKKQTQIKKLNICDELTDLYNRWMFQKELKKLRRTDELPVAIIVYDLDGLQLINDVLGYETGDKLLRAFAGILKSSFREKDVAARIGGDEFGIIMRGCDEKAVDSVIKRIAAKIEDFNSKHEDLYLSASVGYSIKYSGIQDVYKVFNEAGNNMYRNKLLMRQTAKNAISLIITRKLRERNSAREGRIERLIKLAEAFGKKLDLSQENMEKFLLLCRYHDVGEISLPQDLLVKKGRITWEEREIWRKHCTAGYRIAIAVPSLSGIADLILSHHEHYDGSGYLFKLRGKEIPFLSRVFAIIDAYEAMTGNRPYRKPLSHEEAVEELKRCAGTQFDPELVKLFTEMGPVI